MSEQPQEHTSQSEQNVEITDFDLDNLTKALDGMSSLKKVEHKVAEKKQTDEDLQKAEQLLTTLNNL